MKTSIAPAAKHKVQELISKLNGDNLSIDEVEQFNRFVLASAKIWIGSYDGKLLCLWGLIPPTLLSDQAYLWLHVTEAAAEHTFVLVRRSQIEVGKMLEEYPRIVGHCVVGADQSIRWLKWLGAEFHEPVGPVIPFTIRGKNG